MKRRRPDPARMERALADLLAASGLDPEAPDFVGTPKRVAKAWLESFLDGYAKDAKEILADAIPAVGADAVVVRGIAFHGMCPHHLLPFAGKATVAYVPGDRAAGFGRLIDLVDCFAHRFSLQERIARNVADALVAHLGAAAAACGLDAEHGCMTLRGPGRHGSRVWADAFAGDERWRERLGALLKD